MKLYNIKAELIDKLIDFNVYMFIIDTFCSVVQLFLHTIIKYQVFLSNTNNLYTVVC